ncbi:MAG: metal-dependent hydrolase [Alphaproteobacteria bacterium]|nr:MAG: metal-dependent hydrolase [Alphaproteobacteria bacterium]
MLLFGHLGITLGIFFGLGIFVPRLRTIIDPRYLAIGALLPDLLDKPIGRVIFASSIANGRIIGHTLFFSILLLLIGLYLYEKRRDIIVIALATGSFFHLFEDQMWAQPHSLFWPLFGFDFPKDHTDYTGLEYLLTMFERSFQHGFSESHIPEIMGMGIMLIASLYWLKKRLDKKNS